MKRYLLYILKSLSCMIIVFIFFNNAVSSQPILLTDMAKVTSSEIERPPDWACMERQLIKTMEEAALVYLKTYTGWGGTVHGFGTAQNMYEMFYNWSLFYAIGADDEISKRAAEEYEAITRQCTYQDCFSGGHFIPPQLFKEFFKGDCWYHIGEGMNMFYGLPLADPTNPENIDRARRFAGFYLNEDPDALNYDPEKKIIRAFVTGSKGPSKHITDHPTGLYLMQSGYASFYPLFPKIKDRLIKLSDDPKQREKIIKLFDEMIERCDTPTNLAATGLITNAYLYTGEEKYKKWVIDYVEAWMKRIEENNGIIPDNIGQTGKIGEYRNGQWWGGFYGWTGHYGALHIIFMNLTIDSECAHLLTGDPRYLDLLRSQIDVIFDNSITTEDGQLLVPYNYGPDGWTRYLPMLVRDLAHLWHASMEPQDWQRIERLMKGNRFYPLPNRYSLWYIETHFSKQWTEKWQPAEPFDWNFVPSTVDRDADNPTEFPRLMYYAEKNPDWPYEILAAEYEQCLKMLEVIKNENRDVTKIDTNSLHFRNPVSTKGLVQVTMGSPQTIYNGGLLRARVRYFDTDRARPGLPLDVAALVEKIEADRIVVKLVNLSALNTRRLIIQAGAFGEHEFTEVKYYEQNRKESGQVIRAEKKLPVNKKFFAVELLPGTSIRLEIGTRMFVNKPTYAFPWH